MTDEKHKSGLDEQSFGKLLEAAYVVQEHNRERRRLETEPKLQSGQTAQLDPEGTLPQSMRPVEESARLSPDDAIPLAEIVEAQHQIQVQRLELDQAMAVVADRIARITDASGAAIGIVEGKMIRYRAAAGISAPPLGSDGPLETALCVICVSNAQVLRTPDVNALSVFDRDLCRQRDIQSLAAVPIYHDGNVVGALELYFDRLNGFAEQDIQTCQLMAGLVTEAIGRDAGSALRKSMAAERSSMLAAIEKIKPNLAALAAERAGEKVSAPNARLAEASLPDPATSSVCWKCGSTLVEEEHFCGKCGAPRIGETEPSSIQSKLASALHMHQASQGFPLAPLSGSVSDVAALKTGNAEMAASGDEGELLQRFSPYLFEEAPREETAREIDAQEALPEQSLDANAEEPISAKTSSTELQSELQSTTTGIVGADLESPDPVRIASPPKVDWSSALKARNFLEAVIQTRSPGAFARLWQARRGDFYLAVAVILVLIAILWGILSNHPVSATNGKPTASGSALRHRPPADDLSLFDKFLINLGLAEAPDTPEYKYLGNPSTQVWIDTHTALYYCPGSEFYGKTPKGRFSSQHDAQLDQFEPATRRACD